LTGVNAAAWSPLAPADSLWLRCAHQWLTQLHQGPLPPRALSGFAPASPAAAGGTASRPGAVAKHAAAVEAAVAGAVQEATDAWQGWTISASSAPPPPIAPLVAAARAGGGSGAGHQKWCFGRALAATASMLHRDRVRHRQQEEEERRRLAYALTAMAHPTLLPPPDPPAWPGIGFPGRGGMGGGGLGGPGGVWRDPWGFGGGVGGGGGAGRGGSIHW